jgi:ubiquinone/menaquinone biosynthesis C-methylase UbiE
MTADHYAASGRRWARGAELVYGPLAAELVAMSPHPLAGRVVLDVGAGTGAASRILLALDARPIAVDRSLDMLAWSGTGGSSARTAKGPPGVVADIRALPLGPGSVDDAVAAFVLNHLTDPAAGLAELVRVTRPGGCVLASVFSSANASAARDLIDATAVEAGWVVPSWYTELKYTAMPILGNARAMESLALAAGLTRLTVRERPVDVGVTEPEQLVSYRLGHPAYAAWLDGMGPGDAQRFARRAADAIRPIMRAYRPVVVFLAAVSLA